MEFQHLTNHKIRTHRWNNFYRVTSDSGKKYIISNLLQGEEMTDWACNCLGWINYHKDCKHIRELKSALRLAPTQVREVRANTVRHPAELTAFDEPKAIAKIILNEFDVLDLSD